MPSEETPSEVLGASHSHCGDVKLRELRSANYTECTLSDELRHLGFSLVQPWDGGGVGAIIAPLEHSYKGFTSGMYE
ncbi:hypothetical protein Y032_0426g1247 [Ancylostoma ceylanicum]|uniref:Uncharacterized protein n=1 Tax=Ancylostoma ceylanicum TaxID=53326 RepID=A0A016X2J0_9BILA|nr:hypothetical protein Y032_0426g1247 [Ancylostoma ceylanicum]